MTTQEQQIDLQHIGHLRTLPSQRRPFVSQLLKGIRQCQFAYLKFWSTEPRIRMMRRCSGNVGWRVNDPLSKRTLWFDSKEQVLIWLEERHHRHNADSETGWAIEDWP